VCRTVVLRRRGS